MQIGRIILVFFLIGGLFAIGNAQEIEEPDQIRSGLITPDSMLYSFERLVDTFALHFGIISAGNLADERASEAYLMFETDNQQGMDRATDSMKEIADQADKGDVKQLEAAAFKLGYITVEKPDERRFGVGRAMRDLKYKVMSLTAEKEDQASTKQPKPEENESEPDHTLTLRNDTATPSSITVAPEEVIKIVNEDVYSHTVTNDQVLIDKDVSAKEATTISFFREGTYEIHCRYHDEVSLTVTVEE